MGTSRKFRKKSRKRFLVKNRRSRSKCKKSKYKKNKIFNKKSTRKIRRRRNIRGGINYVPGLTSKEVLERRAAREARYEEEAAAALANARSEEWRIRRTLPSASHEPVDSSVRGPDSWEAEESAPLVRRTSILPAPVLHTRNPYLEPLPVDNDVGMRIRD